MQKRWFLKQRFCTRFVRYFFKEIEVVIWNIGETTEDGILKIFIVISPKYICVTYCYTGIRTILIFNGTLCILLNILIRG